MKPAPKPVVDDPFQKVKDRLAELLDALGEKLFPRPEPEPLPVPVRVRDRR
ncbi:MAG: DNA topoisomerase I [Deltaproteobacteria bacterium]|nr:DNA topoisomerase I [Deltaproteobacteria bacterium]